MIRSASHTFTRQRRFTAWLGVFAICLTVFMPLLTQWIGTPGPPDPAICSASHHVAQSVPDGGSSRSPVHGFDSCGYCSLLTHTPFVTSGNPVVASFAPPPAVMRPMTDAPSRSASRYSRALPRAPPRA
jgi:hypothetical protein